MITYFDASSLVKYFIEEAGSPEIRELVAESIPVTSRLSAIEITSALCRRSREGHLSEEERGQAIALLDEMFGKLYVVELTPEIADGAKHLLQQHPLRAGDAIQLASFLAIRERTGKDVRFSAFDQRLIDVAELAIQ